MGSSSRSKRTKKRKFRGIQIAKVPQTTERKTKALKVLKVDKNCEQQTREQISLVSDEENRNFTFSSNPNLEEIRQQAAEFADERNWNQFHQPRNLLLAMVGEVGELSELFQWRGEVKPGLPGWTDKEKEHLGEELSDVLIYLIRLSDKCNIDLPAAVVKKMALNAEKYPASKVYGSDKKYNEYNNS